MDSIRSKCTTCQPGGSGRLSKAIRLWTGFGIKTSLAGIVPLNCLMWNYWSDLSLHADSALFTWVQILSLTRAEIIISNPPSFFHAHARTYKRKHTNSMHKAAVYPQTDCQWPCKPACITNSSSYSFKVIWLHQSWLLRRRAIKI